jgi:hypothetical protein
VELVEPVNPFNMEPQPDTVEDADVLIAGRHRE